MLDSVDDIWQSDLSAQEKLTLVILYTELLDAQANFDNKDNRLLYSLNELAQKSSLSKNEITEIVINLDHTEWLDLIAIDKVEHDLSLIEIKLPFIKIINNPINNEIDRDHIKDEDFDEEMDLILSYWRKHFKSRPMTPTEYTYLMGYIEKGIEPDLIVELLAYTANQGVKNPISYLKSILNDLYNKNIKNLDDYLDDQEEMNNIGKESISENNKRKEERDKFKDISELKKRGWNQ
ncbi:MAG: DnaD domain protein [Bacillota bacterium]